MQHTRKSWNDSLTEKILTPIVTVNLSPTKTIIISNLLFIVSILGVLPFVILIWQVHSTKKTGGLVLAAFYLGLVVSTIWLLYGIFVLKNVIVIISSTLLIIAKGILIYLIIKSRSDNPNSEEDDDEALI